MGVRGLTGRGRLDRHGTGISVPLPIMGTDSYNSCMATTGPKPSRNTIPCNLMIDPELKAALIQHAKWEDLSMSQLVRKALRLYIAGGQA